MLWMDIGWDQRWARGGPTRVDCVYPRVIKLTGTAGTGGSGYHIENGGYPRVNNCGTKVPHTTRITRIFAMNNADLSGSK